MAVKTRVPFGMTALGLAASAFLVLVATQGPGARPASAVTGATVSVDAIPDASNTATSVGTINSCTSTTAGSSFDIDVVIQNVTGISGFQANLLYTASVLNVTGVNYQWLLASTLAGVVDVGSTVPDASGDFLLAATQFPAAPASGSGVLVRVTLQAVGAGSSGLQLSNVKLSDSLGNPISVTLVNNATVYVNSLCPTPTSCSAVPIWPVPPGDSDCDGFTDVIENFVGTNSLAACGPNDWPPDFNGDTHVNLNDIVLLKPHFNSTAGPSIVAYSPGESLAADMSSTQMTLSASGTTIVNGQVVQVDSEQMKVTAGGGTSSLTVQRGYNGTAAAAHLSNSGTTPVYYVAYDRRFDLNADGRVNLNDIVILKPFFNLSCTP